MPHIPSRAELQAALNDTNPANPLAVAIADALTNYQTMLNEQATRAGAWPNPFNVPMPRTVVDAFALELFTTMLADVGVRVAITVSTKITTKKN